MKQRGVLRHGGTVGPTAVERGAVGHAVVGHGRRPGTGARRERRGYRRAQRTGEIENSGDTTEAGWARRYFEEYNCCAPSQRAGACPRTYRPARRCSTMLCYGDFPYSTSVYLCSSILPYARALVPRCGRGPDRVPGSVLVLGSVLVVRSLVWPLRSWVWSALRSAP